MSVSVESFRGPGGATLYYRYDDFTDPWSVRPTIVMAHGHPRNSNMWYAWVPGLARDFRVVRTDLRGLGLSKVPIETFQNSVESLMLDAIALFDHLRIDKAIWIGEATGAMLGIYLATTVPERLHCLVAMSIALRIRDAPVPSALAGKEGMELMLKKGMRSWAQTSVRNRPWHREAPPGYVQWYADQIAQNDPRLAAEFYRPMPEIDALPLLKDIGVPTLYLTGDRDQMALPEHLEALRQNPKTRVASITGPGYDIGYARTEACLAEVRGFFRELGL